MRHLLLALIVVVSGCTVRKHMSPHTPQKVSSYDMSKCKNQSSFATQDVAVVIVRDCFFKDSTLVVVAFSSEFYDVAAEEAANITIKLLGYKPVLTPIFNTYLLSSNKKHRRPMIIFAVTGKKK
jgi:hypothetical protein